MEDNLIFCEWVHGKMDCSPIYLICMGVKYDGRRTEGRSQKTSKGV